MKTTREVGEELNMGPAALRQHIHSGNIAAPKHRAGMVYLWTSSEIELARQQLNMPGRRRPRYVAGALQQGDDNGK